MVKDAKSIIEWMAAGSSVYVEVNVSSRDQLERVVEENYRPKAQIQKIQESHRWKEKEPMGINLIDALCDFYGSQDHRDAQCPKACLAADLEGWSDQNEAVNFVTNQRGPNWTF